MSAITADQAKLLNGFFVAIFRRSREFALKQPLSGSEKRSEKKVGDRLTENQSRIVDCIRADPSMTAKEIAERIGISARKVEANIAKLKTRGLLRRVGPDKGGHWEIKKDSEGGAA